jgi:hypothetical protein
LELASCLDARSDGNLWFGTAGNLVPDWLKPRRLTHL